MTEAIIKDDPSLDDIARNAIGGNADANEEPSLHGTPESVWELWIHLMQRQAVSFTLQRSTLECFSCRMCIEPLSSKKSMRTMVICPGSLLQLLTSSTISKFMEWSVGYQTSFVAPGVRG